MPHVPAEEQVRRQGVRPIRSVDELALPGVWESDEELDEFLADLYVSRHAHLTSALSFSTPTSRRARPQPAAGSAGQAPPAQRHVDRGVLPGRQPPARDAQRHRPVDDHLAVPGARIAHSVPPQNLGSCRCPPLTRRSWAAGLWIRAYDAKIQHAVGRPITLLSEAEARERLRRGGSSARLCRDRPRRSQSHSRQFVQNKG